MHHCIGRFLLAQPDSQNVSELASALLRKYDIPHTTMRLLGTGTNTSWHAEGTPYVVRVADESVDNGMLQLGLQASVALQRTKVRFVTPAFPFVIQTETKSGQQARGTIWFYEESTGKPTDYRLLGQLVRDLQEEGTEAVKLAGVQLPDAMNINELKAELAELRKERLIDFASHQVLASWIPRIQRGASRLPESKRVLVHDDLWEVNTIMTSNRGLVLCDPDNLSWGRADYDLAFITRGREAGKISKEQVRAFEDGYGGHIPDINTAWRMAMFHRFRWVCRLAARAQTKPEAAKRLADELELWRRKRGPQP
jgi:aminoglycoside phosphotransferase (APT) family kinase protein